jgi:hypothetical protein
MGCFIPQAWPRNWQPLLRLDKSKVFEKYQPVAQSKAYSADCGLFNLQVPMTALEDRLCGAL